MKKKISPFMFIGLIIFFACCNKHNPDAVGSICDSIPKDAITFDYNRGKQIILKGMLNDSIPLNILFDTGGASCINLSDSLKGKFGLNRQNQICKLEIGKYSKQIPINFGVGKDFSKKIRTNKAIINWTYFENEIIKISFQHKYIQVLNNTINTSEYDSIKMRLSQKRLLTIPVEIHVQGKVIIENLWFDTGFHAPIYVDKDIIKKYELNVDSAEHSPGMTHGGQTTYFWIKADSAGVNKHFVPIYILLFGDVFKSEYYSGLIGNAFFDNFDLILDFKNFVLYLKPIDKT